MALALRATTNPSDGERALVFADEGAARAHLEKHVATWPESRAWAVILDRHELAEPSTCHEVWRALAIDAPAAQALYDSYAVAVDGACTDARRLQWWVQDPSGATIAMGTTGVLTVVADNARQTAVKTAFVPAQSPLRRGAGLVCWLPKKLRRERLERESTWSREDRIYYMAFRPAVQFVRQTPFIAYDLTGRRYPGEPVGWYCRLRSRLPRMSRLKLEDWKRYRHP